MARFDVFRFQSGYVLDVQADHLTRFETRVVAPLLLDGSVPTPMPRALLGRPVCSVSEH